MQESSPGNEPVSLNSKSSARWGVVRGQQDQDKASGSLSALSPETLLYAGWAMKGGKGITVEDTLGPTLVTPLTPGFLATTKDTKIRQPSEPHPTRGEQQISFVRLRAGPG